MKGIILAGGAGTRLRPLTDVVCKQLLPVYNKPMIYYPLTTLMEGGVREICIISTPKDIPRFEEMLGSGSKWGVSFNYREQEKPAGLAQAFTIGESFIGNDPVTLILGDNIFSGASDKIRAAFRGFKEGETIFGYKVKDWERYGVVELDKNGKPVRIVEKPKTFVSNLAVPGLYICDNSVVEKARNLAPSPRGELEITDVNRLYLEDGRLSVIRLGRAVAWLDAGTFDSLEESGSYIKTIEKRQGLLIGSPEQAAYESGFISREEFERLLSTMPKNEYRASLETLLEED